MGRVSVYFTVIDGLVTKNPNRVLWSPLEDYVGKPLGELVAAMAAETWPISGDSLVEVTPTVDGASEIAKISSRPTFPT